MTKFFLHTAIFLSVLLLGISCGGNQPQVANPSNDASVTYLQLINSDQKATVLSAQFTIDHTKNEIYNVDSLPYATKVDSLYLSIKFASTLGYIMNDTISESYLTPKTTNAYDLTQPVTIKNLATDAKTTKTYTLRVNVHTVKTYQHVWEQINSDIDKRAGDNQKAFLLHDTFCFIYQEAGGYVLYTSMDAKRWQKNSSPTGLPKDIRLSQIFSKGDSALLLHQGSLYTTTDAHTWTSKPVEGDGDYDYVSLLFLFKNEIWALARHKTNSTIKIAHSKDGVKWSVAKDRSFVNDFPDKDFATTTFQPRLGREKLIVVGGRNHAQKTLNSRWSAENILNTNKLNWVNLHNEQSTFLPLSATSVVYYGSKLLLIGGLDAQQKTLQTEKQLQQSIDEGLTWTVPDSTTNVLPKEFVARSATSVILHDNSLYIIGGKGETASLSDVWKVRVNFYNFKDPSKY